MNQWEEAYDEFLREISFLQRPSAVFCWLQHPLLDGKYVIDLGHLYGKPTSNFMQ